MEKIASLVKRIQELSLMIYLCMRSRLKRTSREKYLIPIFQIYRSIE